MDSVVLQLRAAHAFAKKYPWYRIARDPWEARRIIHDGHLAVVLEVEVSHLMPEKHGHWQHQVQELYDLGVRSIEIAHETDSDFAGAAAHHGLVFFIAQKVKHRGDHSMTQGMKSENAKGLTQKGRLLIREMARRKMVITLDHVSRRARRHIYDMVTDRAFNMDLQVAIARRLTKPKRLHHYPIFFSHSRFDALLPTKDQLENRIGKDNTGEKEAKGHKGWGGQGTGEYMATDHGALWVRETGGVFGLRTGPNAMRTYRRSGVANRCLTSSRSFAQMYAYGLHRFGIAMALGSDINGFVAQLAPRFGNQACSKLGNQRPDNALRDHPLGGSQLSEFDRHGLKHIGLEPDLIKDLDHLGLDMSTMHRSAENFLRMWERAYDPGRGKLSARGYEKLMQTPAADDVRPSDANASNPARSSSRTSSKTTPKCPSGYSGYQIRNPLNKDRCRKTTVTTAALKCKLLVTDKRKNWTGPHAKKGADECRSKKGKKPKGVKCSLGFKHQIQSGRDSCTKTKIAHKKPVCPSGYKYKSQSGKDTCTKR